MLELKQEKASLPVSENSCVVTGCYGNLHVVTARGSAILPSVNDCSVVRLHHRVLLV